MTIHSNFQSFFHRPFTQTSTSNNDEEDGSILSAEKKNVIDKIVSKGNVGFVFGEDDNVDRICAILQSSSSPAKKPIVVK
jgi:hypothetical protein